MKHLILGCGKHYNKQDNDTCLDVHQFTGVDIVHNLDVVPWPIKDNSFDSIIATHVIEHLDSLVNFMDECHRILVKGGNVYLETPHADKENFDLMFCDPTHRHYYRKHSFINYFTKGGVETFGYTQRPWSLWHIEVKDGVLIVHAEPIKK
jgi:predicted SAM-dependent methyltransferase